MKQIAPSHVFQNYRSRKVPNTVVSQQKPNVHVYGWRPNRNAAHLQQPWERGTFFVNAMASGLGSVGVPGDSLKQTVVGQDIGQFDQIAIDNSAAAVERIRRARGTNIFKTRTTLGRIGGRPGQVLHK